ncbi:hypothetical protein D3C85_1168550 [compost metagenome]
MGDQTRARRTDFAHQTHDHPGGQAVSLDGVIARQRLHLCRPTPVPADDLGHQPFMSEPLQTAALPVANAQGMHHGQPAGVAGTQKRILDGCEQCVRFQQSPRTADRDGGSVGNPAGHIRR